jgi:CheY-like chemotaxis protein
MRPTNQIASDLAEKLELLAAETGSVRARDLLGDCKRLCFTLTNDAGGQTLPTFSLPKIEKAPVILVIDDDEDFSKLVKYLLRKQGFEVICRRNPVEVLEESDAIQPDFILLDLMMPEMGGFELLPKLKSHPKYSASKVVICSARSFEKDRRMALALGAIDFFDKPIDVSDLAIRIKSLMQNSSHPKHK